MIGSNVQLQKKQTKEDGGMGERGPIQSTGMSIYVFHLITDPWKHRTMETSHRVCWIQISLT